MLRTYGVLLLGRICNIIYLGTEYVPLRNECLQHNLLGIAGLTWPINLLNWASGCCSVRPTMVLANINWYVARYCWYQLG